MGNVATSAVWLCAMLASVGLLGGGVTLRRGVLFVIAAGVVAFVSLYLVPSPDWVGLSIALLVGVSLWSTRFFSPELRAMLAGICAGLGTALYAQSGVVWWQAAGLFLVAMLAGLTWMRLARPDATRLDVMALLASGVAVVVGYWPALVDGWQSGAQLAQQSASDAANHTLPIWVVGAVMVAALGGACMSIRGRK